jgi:hypothetical protein
VTAGLYSRLACESIGKALNNGAMKNKGVAARNSVTTALLVDKISADVPRAASQGPGRVPADYAGMPFPSSTRQAWFQLKV